MKRNMDLVRLILLEIEKSDEEEIQNMEIDGYSSEDIKYNAALLKEKNMIDTYQTDIIGNYYIGSLTWDGCDFLDKVRDNTFWHKTKEVITKKGLPMLVETIKSVATALITSATEGAVNAILKNGGQP